ncbi:MAG: transporter substrate-binding domain-containing protein [Alphaproteobacteria bacterium]|nr:transporter substrate-binding domain-containing protein [Alphaproteobacteria bacterium]
MFSTDCKPTEVSNKRGSLFLQLTAGAIILTFLFLPIQLRAAELLRFSTSVKEPFSNNAKTGIEDRLAREVFRRLGHDIDIYFTSPEKALRKLNEGVDDGTFGRVIKTISGFPNIRIVPEPAYSRDFVVFSQNAGIKVKSWSDLNAYRVGVMSGWKAILSNLQNVQSLSRAKSRSQLFLLLETGQVDLVIYNRLGGVYAVDKAGLENVSVVLPPLLTAPHYFSLHQKHEALIIPAAKALREIKRDGTYDKIFKAFVASKAK